MNATSGVDPSTAATAVGFDPGMTNLSADALLAYCQAQLGDLDSQIAQQMTAQKTALKEREAVQGAQQVLSEFGSDGPQSGPDMQKCVTALDNAISLLPADDPARAQLTKFKTDMMAKYGYQPPGLTGDQEAKLAAAQGLDSAYFGAHGVHNGSAQATINYLQDVRAHGALSQPPNKDNKQWSGTTEALSNITADIKSSAEIQMLQLQDLVSQRQQAVQLCSGMMSKTDQTLEDQAKAIGR